jgi:N-acetylneuraminic acid mutarotase
MDFTRLARPGLTLTMWASLIAATCLVPGAASDAARGLGPAVTAPSTWSTPTSLPAPRVRPAAATGKDGNIYVFGGSADNIDYDTTFIYNPRTGSWTEGANMPTAREGAQAVTLPDGRIIVLGGGTGCHGTQHCAVYGVAELYTPRTNTWRAAAFLQTPRYRFAAALGKDGRVYAIGGWDGNHALYSVEAYSPRTNTWAYAPSLPLAERAPAAAVDRRGRIIVVGGDNAADTGTAYYNSTFIYSNGGWSNGTPMPTAREDLGAARGADGQIYAVGGYNSGGYLATTEAYNPDTNTWSIVGSLPLKICCAGVVAVATGQIYAIGGEGDSSTQVAMLDVSSILRLQQHGDRK